MLTEPQIVELLGSPDKIISAIDCNACIAYLNGLITDLHLKEFELELLAGQHRVELLQREGKTNNLSEAEFKISEPYKNWRTTQNSLRKFRALRKNLYSKEEILKFAPKHYTGVI